MKMKHYVIACVLLIGAHALNAMDLEKENPQRTEDLISVPLEQTSSINQFKALFAATPTQEIIQKLHDFRNQPETLQAIKTWLKEQKVSPDQSLLNTLFYTTYTSLNFSLSLLNTVLAISAFKSNSVPSVVLTSVAGLVSGGIFIYFGKKAYKIGKAAQTIIEKNNKIRTLLSVIRHIKKEQ